MAPIRRGFVLIVTLPATRTEAALEELLRSSIARLPGATGGDPVLWIDARAGVALGIPEEAESAAAISFLGRLPGDITVAIAGMHGKLTGLREHVPGSAQLPTADLIAAAIAAHGPEAIATMNDDPVAFAIWDGGNRTAWISRDRAGHVPVFHGRVGSDYLVATHLTAFDAHPRFDGAIDTGAVAGLLRHRTPPIPDTIFRGIKQLLPGSRLVLRTSDSGVQADIAAYWSLAEVHRQAISHRSQVSPAEASSELERLLRHSIDRSLGDSLAPLGLFFSAGVDSNLVAAVATTTSHPVHTFTASLADAPIDESPAASTMAALLGANHTTVTIDPVQLLSAIERSGLIYGQPHGDQASLPAILMADQAATVSPLVITGDGGNDLLGSDRSLAFSFPLLPISDRVPDWLHPPLAAVANTGARGVERFERIVDRYAPASKAAKIRAGGLRRLAATWEATEPEMLYRARSSHNIDPARFLAEPVRESLSTYSDPTRWLGAGTRADRWRHAELNHVSIQIEGSKHEGAITAAGAGYRAPLLDPGLVSFALSLPNAIRDRDGVDRWPSVDIIRRLIPAGSQLPTPGGFGVPTDRWLRNELRPWAEALLSESNLRATGIFNIDAVRMEWRQHLSGQHDRRYVLWPILMTLVWLDARSSRRT